MFRSLYIRLLRLHPAAFRQRFGDEMLGIYDLSRGRRERLLLLCDALVSLGRQWLLRPEFRSPQLAAHPAIGAPLFRSLDSYKPRPTAMIYGGILTVGTLYLVAYLSVNGARRPQFLIGVHHPSPHLLAVDRASVEAKELTTTVRLAPEPEDPLRPIALAYFRAVRVLKALDADQDLAVSPGELAAAPVALRKLDKDHDGKLSAEECGLFASVDIFARARREFMAVHPVLAALDSDHDGEISAAEIANSSRALKKLDRNRDGSLTIMELLPDQAAAQASIILVRLDRNNDGAISRAELDNEDAQQVRELLRSADRNHDGVVTREELRIEVQLRIEREKNLDRARRTAGSR